MQARYGVKFHSQFKSEEQLDYAKREWLDELSKLDEPTVLRGMDGMLKAFMSWPPNLQEFLALCRPQREHGQMYKQFVPMLCKSTQAERDALAAIHLTALKNMLR